MIKKILTNLLLIKLSLVLVSCGGSPLFSKKTLDPYTLTKKRPLIMPPDMVLRPPGKEQVSMKNSSNSISEEDAYENELSIDDILLGKKNSNKKKRSKQDKELITDILKAKAQVILN
ncbi:MAG: hypothetical protein CMP24_06385 [Rickettsiales bacterium]|nr:hypothetical protein [Rickettsiales bacterium]|tara:strand:+ start:982 stop:1332 length:351 start_codon:yes stop_codon:yes gene_type:complete